MNDKIKDLKYLEEFELVDNSKQEIYNDKEARVNEGINIDATGNKKTYRQKDVYVEPVYKSATSIKYNIYYIGENNELEKMGTVKDNKQIILDAKYRDRKRLEIDGKEFDFDSEKIEVDIQRMLEEQRLRDEEKNRNYEKEDEEKSLENGKNSEAKKEENEEDKEEQDKEQQEKKEEENDKENFITDEELIEQGYDTASVTRITDKHVIDSMIVENFNPYSLSVVEKDNKPVFLVKENGTGELRELPIKTYDNSMEEVNEFENNVERTRGAGTKVTLSNCPGMEFNVNKNKIGQTEVGLIGNIDEQGNREVLSIGSPVHPTEQEYQRAESEKYERYGYGQILTKDEVDARLADEVESVRDEVGQEIETMAKNPTLQELEEKIKDERERQAELTEKEIKENEDEIEEEEEYEKVPWDRHPHP